MVYLAPGLHPPLLAGLHVTICTQWGRNAGQELAVKRPQAPVVLAVHTLNLPGLEAPAAVPGALYVERKGGSQSTVKFQACRPEEGLVLVQVKCFPSCHREGVTQADPGDGAPSVRHGRLRV